MHGWQRGYPQINGPAFQRNPGAPILRQPFFGDVHVRHDLEPGDHGTLQTAGRILALLQNAIDAVANAEPLLVRFEMNVRRPAGDRLPEDGLDEPDDRRLVIRGARAGRHAPATSCIGRRSAGPIIIMTIDGLPDILRRRDRGLDR